MATALLDRLGLRDVAHVKEYSPAKGFTVHLWKIETYLALSIRGLVVRSPRRRRTHYVAVICPGSLSAVDLRMDIKSGSARDALEHKIKELEEADLRMRCRRGDIPDSSSPGNPLPEVTFKWGDHLTQLLKRRDPKHRPFSLPPTGDDDMVLQLPEETQVALLVSETLNLLLNMRRMAKTHI